jgi:serine/threonine-protein kinase HipA
LLVNYALRNANAHLKNFTVTYTTDRDVSLAPVYDIVTVNAYRKFEHEIPALPLKGKRIWTSGQLLDLYAASRLGLSATDRAHCVQSVRAAIDMVAPRVAEHAERYPEFREIAQNMLDAWGEGLEDISPTARPGKRAPEPLRQRAGLSAPGRRTGKSRSSP